MFQIPKTNILELYLKLDKAFRFSLKTKKIKTYVKATPIRSSLRPAVCALILMVNCCE
jgi:hypothetical protein